MYAHIFSSYRERLPIVLHRTPSMGLQGCDYDPVALTWRYNRAESELDAEFQAMAQWNLTLNDFKGDLAE
ncbi:hypothetical protein U27_01492 [Candidatus Vecturithrix granuli]|uniref:Uncharacterized protein n=1 Tax=Vecturithrix granuli TaxID=1499967 RepID=A0A081CAI6_VECG1|nr:hypothetical protein U27_01492 [Candidatus Vecturithrix granuli]